VQPPDTWEELNAVARQVKAAGLHEFPMGFPWNRTGDGYDPAMSLLWSYGANWVDATGKYQARESARLARPHHPGGGGSHCPQHPHRYDDPRH
jgi:ABC-type glycerol-3-phosphate transport system substrate-binding protein